MRRAKDSNWSRRQSSQKEKVASPSKQNVKLLKLVITKYTAVLLRSHSGRERRRTAVSAGYTKYNGALDNWLAFWNKFEAERRIDGIDGLPFSSEGYEHVKNILQTNYGQTSD